MVTAAEVAASSHEANLGEVGADRTGEVVARRLLSIGMISMIGRTGRSRGRREEEEDRGTGHRQRGEAEIGSLMATIRRVEMVIAEGAEEAGEEEEASQVMRKLAASLCKVLGLLRVGMDHAMMSHLGSGSTEMVRDPFLITTWS